MMVYSNQFVASVKVGGRILREHDKDHVYLPFGSEYSILLKNMQNRKAAITVKIDGNDVLDGHQLIIDAKRTMELERFIVNGNLNSGPRFKFIEKTEQISEHRGDRIDDGIIEIDYQFEVEPPVIKHLPIKEIHHYHHQSWPTYGSSFTYGNTTRGVSDNSARSVFSSQVSGQSVSGGQESNVVADSLSDDGITVQGADCTQQFHVGYIGPLEATRHAICLKLHGTRDKAVINKPLTVQSKIRCDVCGTQNTSRVKFCGNCGNNLTW
jgi:hypothetical protein